MMLLKEYQLTARASEVLEFATKLSHWFSWQAFRDRQTVNCVYCGIWSCWWPHMIATAERCATDNWNSSASVGRIIHDILSEENNVPIWLLMCCRVEYQHN